MEISEVSQVSDLLLLEPIYQFLILICFAVTLLAVSAIVRSFYKAIKGEPSEEGLSDEELGLNGEIESNLDKADEPKFRSFEEQEAIERESSTDVNSPHLHRPSVEDVFDVKKEMVGVPVPIVIEVENLYNGKNNVVLFREQVQNYFLKITNPFRGDNPSSVSDIEQIFEGIKLSKPKIKMVMIELSEPYLIEGDVLSDGIIFFRNESFLGNGECKAISLHSYLSNTRAQSDFSEAPFQFSHETQISFTFTKKGKVTIYLYPVSVVDFGIPTLQEKKETSCVSEPTEPKSKENDKKEMSSNRAFFERFVQSGMLTPNKADVISSFIDVFSGGQSLSDIASKIPQMIAGNAEFKAQIAEYNKSVEINNQYYKSVLAGQDLSRFRRTLAARVLEIQLAEAISRRVDLDSAIIVDNSVSIADMLLSKLDPPQEANHAESQPFSKEEGDKWGTGKPHKGIVFEDGKGGNVGDLIEKSKYKDSSGKPFTDAQYKEYAINKKLSPDKARIALEHTRKKDMELKRKIRLRAKAYINQKFPTQKQKAEVSKSQKTKKKK